MTHKLYFSILLSAFLFGGISSYAQKKIVILHTNDTHSRIEPIPHTDKAAPNLGGVVRRMAFLEQVRSENKNVLLFDSGDFLQGTPYFNFFKGDIEVETMNLMNYDAATLGNHEFDYGLEVLEKIARKAKFPIVSSNYNFSDTELVDLFKPYLIFNKDGVRIGVIGINVHPKGLIAAANYQGMHYLPPIETANKLAHQLKHTHKCDLIICLSHLGYEPDMKMAAETRNINIIVGGHSHTHMKDPDIQKNIDGEDVIVFQTAGRGAFVGRIDVELEKDKK